MREFARHRYRQSQLVGLTREQLTAIARDAQRQRAGATRGEELAALRFPITHARGRARIYRLYRSREERLYPRSNHAISSLLQPFIGLVIGSWPYANEPI